MEIEEITKNENYEISGGRNTSLYRTRWDCVVAYHLINELKYLIIKTKDCFKCYTLCDLGDYNKYAKEVSGREEINNFLNKKWIIVNKKQFETFKRELILKGLED